MTQVRSQMNLASGKINKKSKSVREEPDDEIRAESENNHAINQTSISNRLSKEPYVIMSNEQLALK